MAFTYVLTEDVGKVRLLIPDSKSDAYIFEDDEIKTFLALETGLKRATALALETIASNEALVLKVITLLDVTTDGAKLSDALLKRAEKLRGQASDEEELSYADQGAVVIGMVVDDFTARQAVYQGSVGGLY
jgi:hypothetical protein